LRKIACIGAGYIGLPTTDMFASREIEFIGVDVKEKFLGLITRGCIPIVDPELCCVASIAGPLMSTPEFDRFCVSHGAWP